MTTRRTRKTSAAKAEEPTQEKYKIPQEELENFFVDVEEPILEKSETKKERVRPARTGKVFLGEEDIRQFNAYRKYLKESQGITKVRHKKI